MPSTTEVFKTDLRAQAAIRRVRYVPILAHPWPSWTDADDPEARSADVLGALAAYAYILGLDHAPS